MCGNGVILGYEKIFQVKRVHTKGLSRVLEEMKTRMVYTMKRGLDVLESYRRMAHERITEKPVDRILKSHLSLKVLHDSASRNRVRLDE